MTAPTRKVDGPALEARAADTTGFHPFYERIGSTPAGRGAKIMASLAAAGAFLGLRLLVDGEAALADWSPLLAALITSALLALYVATHTFRLLLTDIRSRAGDAAHHDLLARAHHALRDSRLLTAGVSFALLNCAVGLGLGVPHESTATLATLLLGYAVAGFVCGIAAYAIVGVYIVLDTLPQHLLREHALDYTAPDGCGGTSFVGSALVVFAGVTLVVGVLISLYILNAPWTIAAGARPWWLDSVVAFWLAFPYLMSAAALLLPALGVHYALLEYKRARDVALRRDLSSIEEGEDHGEAERRREEKLRARRLDLHRMRTWPFDLKAHLTYATVLTPNLLATLNSAYQWYGKTTG